MATTTALNECSMCREFRTDFVCQTCLQLITTTISTRGRNFSERNNNTLLIGLDNNNNLKSFNSVEQSSSSTEDFILSLRESASDVLLSFQNFNDSLAAGGGGGKKNATTGCTLPSALFAREKLAQVLAQINVLRKVKIVLEDKIKNDKNRVTVMRNEAATRRENFEAHSAELRNKIIQRRDKMREENVFLRKKLIHKEEKAFSMRSVLCAELINMIALKRLEPDNQILDINTNINVDNNLDIKKSSSNSLGSSIIIGEENDESRSSSIDFAEDGFSRLKGGGGSVFGVSLPRDGDYTGMPSKTVNLALGYAVQTLSLLAIYLGILLPFEFRSLGDCSVVFTSRNPSRITFSGRKSIVPTNRSEDADIFDLEAALPICKTISSEVDNNSIIIDGLSTNNVSNGIAMLKYSVLSLCAGIGISVPKDCAGDILGNLWLCAKQVASMNLNSLPQIAIASPRSTISPKVVVSLRQLIRIQQRQEKSRSGSNGYLFIDFLGTKNVDPNRTTTRRASAPSNSLNSSITFHSANSLLALEKLTKITTLAVKPSELQLSSSTESFALKSIVNRPKRSHLTWSPLRDSQILANTKKKVLSNSELRPFIPSILSAVSTLGKIYSKSKQTNETASLSDFDEEEYLEEGIKDNLTQIKKISESDFDDISQWDVLEAVELPASASRNIDIRSKMVTPKVKDALASIISWGWQKLVSRGTP